MNRRKTKHHWGLWRPLTTIWLLISLLAPTLAAAQSPPGSPGGVVVVRGDGSLSVSWSAPGGFSGVVYNVRYSGPGRSPAVAASALSATSLEITSAYGSAVHNGESFTVGVQAADSSDPTMTSDWVDVAVPAVAPAALGAIGMSRGAGTLWVSWPDPGPDAAGNYPSGFDVLTRPVGQTGDWTVSISRGASDRIVGVDGLNDCLSYDVRVRAVNRYSGVGPSSAAVTTTAHSPTRSTGPQPLFTPSVTLTRGDGHLTVSWSGTRATSCQGNTLSGYVLEYNRIGQNNWPSAHTQPDATATSWTINHINNNASYKARLRPVYGPQHGNYTTTNTVGPLQGVPSRINVNSITRDIANNTVTFTFTPPPDAGNIPSYDITYSTDDPNRGPRQWQRAVNNKTVAQHTGLSQTNNTVTFTKTAACAHDYYIFGTRVRNSAGASNWRNTTTLPPAPGAHPAAPSALTATGATKSASLAWTAANNNPITKWQYQQKPGTNPWSDWTDIPNSATGETNNTSYTVTNLNDGTNYQFKVRAHHQSCNGAASSTAQTATTMRSPGGVVVVRGDGSLSVSWSAPGGFSGVVYNVRYSGPGRSPAVAASALSATSLEITSAYGSAVHNGESFTVGVQAADSSDPTMTSDWVDVAVPAVAPAALGAIGMSRGAGTLWVSWPDPGPDAAGNYPSGFDVLTRPVGQTGDWTVSISRGASDRIVGVDGLNDCLSYDVRVRAVNRYSGVGPSSAAVTTTAHSPTRSTGPQPLFTPSVTLTRGDGHLTVSWSGTRATSCQGNTLSGYVLEYNRIGQNNWPSAHTQPDATATSWTINHINNNASYKARLRPVYGPQHGNYTTTNTVGPLQGVPSRINVNSITRDIANNTVTFTFTPPPDAGNAPSYDITYSTDDPNRGPRQWQRAVNNKTVAQHTGLSQTNNTVTFTKTAACAHDYYIFGTRVRNSTGASNWRNTTTLPPAPGAHPAAPTTLTATGATKSASLAWTAANNNPITKWQYQQKPGTNPWSDWTDIPNSATGETNNTSYTVTGLTAGTAYQFKVRAHHQSCNGAASAASAATVPVTTPAAVSFSLVPRHQQIRVTWTEPDTGGSPITRYQIGIAKANDVAASAKTLEMSASARSATLTSTATESSLSNGTSYLVWIAAFNTAGKGALGSQMSAQPTMTPPDAPASPTLTTASRQMSVSWTPPAYTGGSAITDYDVRYRPSGTTDWVDIGHTGTASTATISGLADGTAYEVQVRAVNTVTPSGNGAWSASGTATPTGPPYRPDAPSLTRGDGTLTVRWTAPVNGGSALTEHLIAYKTGSDPWTVISQDAPSTSATIVGLRNGYSYSVRIRAKSLLGNSVWSLASAMTPSATAPAVVSSFYVAPSPTQTRDDVSFDFRASNINSSGSTPTAYQLRYCKQSGGTCDSNGYTVLPAVSTPGLLYVQNLDLGEQYAVQGRARNSVGWSDWLEPPNARILSTSNLLPNAPASLSVTPGDGSMTANWTAPAQPGDGHTITEYLYQWRLVGSSRFNSVTSTTGTTATITNLTNGLDYEFAVSADNTRVSQDATHGARRSAIFTPRAKPAAPAAPALTVGHAHLDVSWTEPDNNGAPIITYEINYRAGTTGDWSSWTYDTVGADTLETIEDLSNGTSYQVRVRALNYLGASDWSSVSSATPTGPPGRPLLRRLDSWQSFPLRVYLTSDSQARSTITHYVIQYRTVGSNSWATYNYTPTTPTAQFQELSIASVPNGTYEMRVRAVNSVGNSVWSASKTITVSGNDPSKPSAPSISGTARNQAAYVTWLAPANNGAEIINYSLSYTSATDNDVANCNTTWTSVTRSTLGYTLPLPNANGTYYCFRVRATNTVGDSTWSNTIIISPSADHPDGIFVTSVTSGDRSLTVNWPKPSNFGNGTFLSYLLRYRKLGGSSWSTIVINSENTTSHTITGLTNGVEYQVAVSALNSNNNAGASEVGQSLKTGIPKARPAVISPVVVARHHKINVTWTEPENNGAPILSYSVEHCKGTKAACSLSTATWITSAHSSHGSVHTIRNLVNDSEYQVRVSAENSLGTSSSALVSATPTTSVADAPSAPTLRVGSDRLRADWSPPSDNGGSAVTGYKVQYKLSSASAWTNATHTGPNNVVSSVFSTTQATISGLTKGSAYDVRVRAVNAIGDGDLSTPSTATTADTTPWAPPTPTLTPGNRKIAVSWQTPPHHGGKTITDYDVQYNTGVGSSWTSFSHTGTTRSATIANLTNGTTHQVRVRAVNEEGNGDWSSPASASPATTAPSSVRDVTVTRRHRTLRLNWDAPADDGGETITGYDVAYKLSTANTWTDFAHSGTGTRADVTGLTNGTDYNLRVRATNSVGDGAWSNFALAVSPTTTKPDALAAPRVTRGNSSLAVEWSAPAYIGASDIHSYKLRYRQTGTTTWTEMSLGTSTTTTVSSLTNDTTYELQVAARNTAVTTFSAWSVSTTATPSTTSATPPTRPELVTLTPRDGKIKASWHLDDNGGSTIENWTIEYRTCCTGDFTQATQPVGSTTSTVISDLTNNTSYEFRVRGTNAIGHSLWSAIYSQRPLATPPSDTDVSTARPFGGFETGNGSAFFELYINANDEKRMWVTHVLLRVVKGTNCSTVAPGSSNIVYERKLRAIQRNLSVLVDSMENNVTHTWCAKAYTEIPSDTDPTKFKESNWGHTVSSITPSSSRPTHPTSIETSPSSGTLSVSWSAPANNGGSAIDSYSIKQGTSVGSKNIIVFGLSSTATSPRSITSLTNGREYHFKLYALNNSGTSAPYHVIAVPAGKPATPTLTLNKGNGEVCATWNEPNANGSPIDQYTVRYRGANLNQNWSQVVFNGTVNQSRITGINTGFSYEYQIKSRNAQGESAWSTSTTIRANDTSACTFS